MLQGYVRGRERKSGGGKVGEGYRINNATRGLSVPLAVRRILERKVIRCGSRSLGRVTKAQRCALSRK